MMFIWEGSSSQLQASAEPHLNEPQCDKKKQSSSEPKEKRFKLLQRRKPHQFNCTQKGYEQ